MTTIALIGDSHAEVLFPLLRPALTAQGYTVALSEARRGWSEASYLRDSGFPARLRAARPEVALIHLGGNNTQSGAAYAATAARMMDELRAAGVKRVFWIGPYVATSNTADAARRHAMTAEEQARVLPPLGARWLDTRPFSGSGHSDGVHFTRTAYADFARRIAAWMEAPETGISLPGAGGGGVGWAWPVAGAAAVLLIGWVVRRMRG